MGRTRRRQPGPIRKHESSKAHEETQKQCDHHLRHHRLGAHAVDVAVPAGDARPDRAVGAGSRRGRRGNRASACARSPDRPAHAGPRAVRAVPAAHQGGQRCGHQPHPRRPKWRR
ncbi:hypothetical protein G6F22_021408 [Rhizopus arrhizus]|nr:hypothetical protein G6F22_021408 [Rhizopus arrhizus]